MVLVSYMIVSYMIVSYMIVSYMMLSLSIYVNSQAANWALVARVG